MKSRLVAALLVFWPWLFLAVMVLLNGLQLHGLVLIFYIQFSLFWVVPAVLIWVIVELVLALRRHRS